MATFRIEEFAGMGVDHAGRQLPLPVLPPIVAAKSITTSGTSAVSATLDPKTRAVRVRAVGGNIAFRIGDSSATDPLAVAGDTAIYSGEVAWFAIDGGMAGKTALKIAAIDIP